MTWHFISFLFSYAVSVIWELDPTSLEVLDVWYGRTVIRSAYKMTYKVAQTIADLTQVGDEDRLNDEAILSHLGGVPAIFDLIPELATKPSASLLPALGELYSSIRLLVRIASHIRQLRIDRTKGCFGGYCA